nr:FkbM family methyltransferase [Nitrosomonas nitrosa]
MAALSVHGVLVPVQPEEVSLEIWCALYTERYEANEALRVRHAVRPGDRVLELGAGIGVVTSIIAAIEGVAVWSFEADPKTAALAQRVIDANGGDNVSLINGILAAGPPRRISFFRRPAFWMSSAFAAQGPYESVLEIETRDIDAFVRTHQINTIVMDIEGAEVELLQNAKLAGVERIFVELHDHLYGLTGVEEITRAMTNKGLIYDPRGSSGPCVLFSSDDGERAFDAQIAHVV